MASCRNEGRWFGGCKFEPRYDTIPPESIGDVKTTVSGMKAFMDAATKKLYVGEVCVRCGRTLHRDAMSKVTPL